MKYPKVTEDIYLKKKYSQQVEFYIIKKPLTNKLKKKKH